MPGQKGQKLGKQRQGLTLFGDWFYRLCDYVGVSSGEVEKLAGQSDGYVSKATRGKIGADPEKVKKLFDTLRYLAGEKELDWQLDWEKGFLNAGGVPSPQDMQQSVEILKTVPEGRSQ